MLKTNFSLTTQGEDTVAGGEVDQVLLALSQTSNGSDVDQAADSLLTLTNNDANDPVTSAIRFDAGAAGTDFTYGINFDAASIGTAEIVLQNAEQIQNTSDGTITLEDGSGADYATFTSATGRIHHHACPGICRARGWPAASQRRARPARQCSPGRWIWRSSPQGSI